jgi:hypothetical protein
VCSLKNKINFLYSIIFLLFPLHKSYNFIVLVVAPSEKFFYFQLVCKKQEDSQKRVLFIGCLSFFLSFTNGLIMNHLADDA